MPASEGGRYTHQDRIRTGGGPGSGNSRWSQFVRGTPCVVPCGTSFSFLASVPTTSPSLLSGQAWAATFCRTARNFRKISGGVSLVWNGRSIDSVVVDSMTLSAPLFGALVVGAP